MVRAAEAAGLAGFAFTEHVFHLDEPRVGEPLPRHALGRRARRARRRRRGSTSARSPQLREAVPAVAVGGGPGARALARRSARARGAGRVRRRACGRLGHDPRLGALPDRRPLDLRLVDAARRPHVPGTTTSRASATPSSTAATTSSRTRCGSPSAGPRCRRDLAGRLDRLAELAAARDVALEINGSDVRVYPELVQLLCESIARAGAPVSLGSDAHRPHRVGSVLERHGAPARRGPAQRGGVRAPRAARLPALSPGSRAALPLLTFAVGVFVISFPMMVIALRDFGPATATLVRLLAGGAVLALAARGTFGALRGSVPPHRRDRGVRARAAVVAAGVRDGARGRRHTCAGAGPRADRDRARGQHRRAGARQRPALSRVRDRTGRARP